MGLPLPYNGMHLSLVAWLLRFLPDSVADH